MAKLSHADSRRMYSWWWDSHISPKNSKWLQENLTDMDVKVKAMIKLIEEDADSFARRAEMYYKKRPELMKLVEEFYRAYRALAERYDHATGVIRHAHTTMAEHFPNQVPIGFADEFGIDPQTPKKTPARSFFESDEISKDFSSDGKRNGAFTEDSNLVEKGRGLKQLNDLFGSGENVKFSGGRARKNLNFQESEVVESEENLRKAIAKLEAEKEVGRAQYQEAVEKLSELNSRISRAEEDSRGLEERASKAEEEARSLKEALDKLETEKEAKLQEYRRSLEKISDLENSLSNAELESQSMKDDLAKIASEKDKALDQYVQSLETIAKLESKLRCAEEDARKLTERAERAESEIEALKKEISELSREKEAAALEIQKCLETNSSLETKLSSVQKETQRLNSEIDRGVAKLKDAEEQCLVLERSNQSLQSQIEALTQNLGNQNQELSEKQKELGRLWTCIQEERLRFVEAETAFQTLQHLHSKVQEELRSVTSELQNRVQLLRELENSNQRLQDQVSRVEAENKNLQELNVSSSVTITNMRGEISSLSEAKGKLEQEVELRVDERNALQQEIYCLKEEINDLNKKHRSILEQVKELQDENTNLKDTCERERTEKEALLERLRLFDQLVEKNSVLENSLSDMSAELEAVRAKIKALEDSCQSLLSEKETLGDELRETNENLGKLSAKNILLENSLSDAHDELQSLKEKSKGLEDSCEVLTREKIDLLGEQERLNDQLQTTLLRLENLEKMQMDTQHRYSILEQEKQGVLGKLQDLQISLDAEKTEHQSSLQSSKKQLEVMESEMNVLRDECRLRAREYEEELDKAFDSQIQIFILQKCAQDTQHRYSILEKEKQDVLGKLQDLQISLDAEKTEHRSSIQSREKQLEVMESEMNLLRDECRLRAREYEEEFDNAFDSQIQIFILQRCAQDLQGKSSEASALSENLVSDLKQQNLEQQTEVRSLNDQASALREGMYTLSKDLDVVIEHREHDRISEDQAYLQCIQSRVEGLKQSVSKAEEESQQHVVENSVLVAWLRELESEAQNLNFEKAAVEMEYRNKSDQFCLLQSEALKLRERNEEMESEIKEKDHKQNLLEIQIASLQGAYNELKGERSVLHKEMASMAKEISVLEEENYAICGEVISRETLSIVLKNCVDEKSLELKMLADDRDRLNEINSERGEKLILAERVLEELKLEKLNLMKMLQKSKDDIETKNNSLMEKEHELEEIEQKLSRTENEKLALHQNLQTLIGEHNEAKRTTEDLAKQIASLSTKSDNLMAENREMKEQNEKQRSEIDTLESLMEELFDELQISTFCHGLYEQKVNELRKLIETFESENASKDVDIKLLKERVSVMDAEIEGLRTQLAACESDAEGLFGELQISNVHHCLYEQKVHELMNATKSFEAENVSKDVDIEHLKEKERTLDAELAMRESEAEELNGELLISTICRSLFEQKVHELMRVSETFRTENASKDDDIRHLAAENKDLRTQLAACDTAIASLSKCVSSLEKHVYGKLRQPHNEAIAVAENHNETEPQEKKDVIMTGAFLDLVPRVRGVEKTLLEIEQLTAEDNAKLAKAMKEIEELRTENRMLGKNSKHASEILEAENPKDIVLDQASESSPYKPDSQILELWETTNDDQKGKQKLMKKPRTERPSSDALSEKEPKVDRQQISKRSADFRGENKKKVLERLNSDLHKLTNLQITVNDLKNRVESAEKNGRGKAAVECQSLMLQLNETDTAILKLFDQSSKLVNNFESGSFSSFDSKSISGLEENQSNSRRRIADQAQRMSEKIGRLQLEVQKIQFLLLKIDDGRESKARSRVSEGNKRRVLLRDYLYGGVRQGLKPKKMPFCACVKPPTQGD